ncbi:MAG TPA: universal stress protein, partial [Dehalococcoidia bacterium]|nr:universal stress protein [Dehalococcoidia bacterium]
VENPTHLHVMHVLPSRAYADPGVVTDQVDDEERKRRALAHLREELASHNLAGVTFYVSTGDPGHEIVDYAETVGADLIVLPSHGRTGLKRLLIGSCAERVVRLAHCQVLVLRFSTAPAA